MIKLNYKKIEIKPERTLGRILLKELLFKLSMFLAFLDYATAIVAAEVGEPAFGDTPDAVSFGGLEVFVIQPPLHCSEAISEKLCHLNVGQRVWLKYPFAEK